MNGPRTYQLEAPTSFYSPISPSARVHRQPDMTAMVDAASSTMTAMRKTIWIARAIARMRCETSSPYRTVSTAGRLARCTVSAIASVSSPRFGTTSKDAGSGFDARFSVEVGVALAHDRECLILVDERDAARLHCWSDSSSMRSSLICFDA